jgi:RNA polymerase sigma-70 factor (ECF subfamily)
MVALVALLREDAEFSMPPFNMWLQGPDEIVAWMTGPGAGCRGSRTFPLEVSGGIGYAQYKPDPAGGHSPWSITTLDVAADGRVSGVHNFLAMDDPKLFVAFGLPPHLD